MRAIYSTLCGIGLLTHLTLAISSPISAEQVSMKPDNIHHLQQATRQVSVVDPVVLPGTKQLDFYDADTDLMRRVFIYEPTSPAPAQGYPVMYLLDGNAFFTIATGLNRLLDNPNKGRFPVIIVAIGYPIDTPFNIAQRWYDLTPPTDKPPASPLKHMDSNYRYGGSDALGVFLEETIKPWVASHYMVDKKRQGLFGHSLGGLYTLNTLLSTPNHFSHYYASSPSLWWNDHYVLHRFQETIKTNAETAQAWNKKILYLSVGSVEKPFMEADLLTLQDALSQVAVHPSMTVFTGADHGTAPMSALGAAFKQFMATDN